MNRWISTPYPRPSASVRLYCLPYAGGSSAIFHGWDEELPCWIEVCPIEIPGRGRRIGEKPLVRISEVAAPLAGALLDHIDRPFAVFGHSMGGLIAFETLRRLQRRGLAAQALFVSATARPQVSRLKSPTYDLPEGELLRELKRLNGTPPEVLENPDLLAIILPIIRADLELCQTYRYEEGPPLECSLVALGGRQDGEICEGRIDAWRDLTRESFHKVMIEGAHFFLNTARNLVLEEIWRHLQGCAHPHRVNR